MERGLMSLLHRDEVYHIVDIFCNTIYRNIHVSYSGLPFVHILDKDKNLGYIFDIRYHKMHNKRYYGFYIIVLVFHTCYILGAIP